MTWYALASYRDGARLRTALVLDETLYDLEALAADLGAPAAAARTFGRLGDVIAAWPEVEGAVAALAAKAAAGRAGLAPVANGVARLAAPYEPYRIFGAASNYIEHAAEMETKLAAKTDSTPFIFMKSQTSVIGPNETVLMPPESKKVDWEVELGVVIGKPGRRIPVERALDHIAGYMVVNDVSARDLTRRSDFPFSHDWFRGKSFDTFTPLGPWFVPKSCIKDPHDLKLQLSVNGEMMQDGNSGEMIFNTYEQIAYLSTLLTLKPGDLLATGTPAGVGMGRGVFLKPGDVMVTTIEGIGSITNPVAAEAV